MRALLLQHQSPRVNYAIPLGLAYIAAVLRNKGIEVKIIDAAGPYAGYSNEDLLKIIKEYQPDFIGLTITTLFAVFAYGLIKEIKNKTKIPIIAGGPHPTLFPREILEQGVDIVVESEGERTMEELADYFLGKKPLEGISGISYRGARGMIKDNLPRAPIAELDSIPFPAKDIFIARDYVRKPSDSRIYGCILTSRGCVGRCAFCSRVIFGNHYRFRSAENILSEMIQLNRAYSLRHFSFIDDVFTANKKRVFNLCQLMRERLDFELSWNCVSRVDCVNRELLEEMKRCGCVSINYGVESANPKTLEFLKKNETIGQIEECIIMTKESGLEVSLNFMWGYPWENNQDLENTAGFVKRISPYVKEVMPGGILIPFPGTRIYDDFKEEFGFKSWWLNQDDYTGRYRKDMSSPFFRIYLFDDHGQIEGGGFFRLKRSLMRRIEIISFWIAWNNLRQLHGPLKGAAIFLAGCVSRLLYQISPLLEKFFSTSVMSLARLAL